MQSPLTRRRYNHDSSQIYQFGETCVGCVMSVINIEHDVTMAVRPSLSRKKSVSCSVGGKSRSAVWFAGLGVGEWKNKNI